MINTIDIKKSQSFFALILLCILFAVLSDKFLTLNNFWNVLRQISVNLVLAVGMTLVIITAGIDLSVGSILALCGAISAGCLKNGIMIESTNMFVEFTPLGAVLVALLFGAIVGAFNGWALSKFNIPAFVVTLAMLTILRGFTMLYTEGYPINKLGNGFGEIGTGWLLGIPVPVWISLIVVVFIYLLMEKTAFGRYVYAIGGNENAARLSGINIAKTKTWVYLISGGLAALGGLIVTARLDSAQPNAGTGYELDAIAAVVIGGTSLAGGKGTVWGTVLGAIIIGVLNNGLVLLNVSPFWQQVVKGAVILIAVIIDRGGLKKE
jgi:ribose transport system permease protein